MVSNLPFSPARTYSKPPDPGTSVALSALTSDPHEYGVLTTVKNA